MSAIVNMAFILTHGVWPWNFNDPLLPLKLTISELNHGLEGHLLLQRAYQHLVRGPTTEIRPPRDQSYKTFLFVLINIMTRGQYYKHFCP